MTVKHAQNFPANPNGAPISPFNFASLYNRPQDSIAPWSGNLPPGSPIDYTDYGYVPNVAQDAQAQPPTNFVKGSGPWSAAQIAIANWFTTRVHLSPLGSIDNG